MYAHYACCMPGYYANWCTQSRGSFLCFREDSLQGQCTLKTDTILSLQHVAGTKFCLCNGTFLQNRACYTRKRDTVACPASCLRKKSPSLCWKFTPVYWNTTGDWLKIVFLFLQICSSLISALMNCYLDDSASTDAISERLRDLCPSLFSNDDAVSTKVKTSL